MLVVVVVVAVVVLLATYVTSVAHRLDRLHARVDASAATLDVALARRAAAAAELARTAALPVSEAAELAEAAHRAAGTEGLGHDREALESLLSRALLGAAGAASPPLVAAVVDEPADDTVTAAHKVAYARRFYNDAVRDTLALRARRVPRLLRLAEHTPRPIYFEIDDTVPPVPPRR